MSQAAEARHRAYALFGRVFVQGLSDDVHATLGALPAVADVLPEPFDADRAAAAHHEALGRQVFPYESAFREADGQLGGRVAVAVREAYGKGGFAPDTASIEADHIGLQLAYLAHLARAEQQAHDDDLRDVAARCVAASARFLDRHALRWWPSFAAALATQTANGWLARVAMLAVELAVGHRGLIDVAEAEAVTLPAAPLLDLSDEQTGLRQIVGHLLRPARSGWFLSLDGMARVAQATGLPGGFGPRVKVLETIWHSAADHHAVALLTEALGAEVDIFAGALQHAPADVHTRLAETRRQLGAVGATALGSETGFGTDRDARADGNDAR